MTPCTACRGSGQDGWDGKSQLDPAKHGSCTRCRGSGVEPENVVTLRNVSLADIPGMLRKMADKIEQGEIAATSALFIIPCDGDWPNIFGWGEHMGDYDNIAVLELAKAWFVNNLTKRT